MKEKNQDEAMKKFDLSADSLEVETIEDRTNLAEPNCFGTLGSLGCAGGCAGTAGTFGCCG